MCNAASSNPAPHHAHKRLTSQPPGDRKAWPWLSDLHAAAMKGGTCGECRQGACMTMVCVCHRCFDSFAFKHAANKTNSVLQLLSPTCHVACWHHSQALAMNAAPDICMPPDLDPHSKGSSATHLASCAHWRHCCHHRRCCRPRRPWATHSALNGRPPLCCPCRWRAAEQPGLV